MIAVVTGHGGGLGRQAAEASSVDDVDLSGRPVTVTCTATSSGPESHAGDLGSVEDSGNIVTADASAEDSELWGQAGLKVLKVGLCSQ